MAASVQQSIDWMGETFTITRKVMTGYDAATTDATPVSTAITVKGIFDDYRSRNLSGNTDVRGDEKAIVIGTKDTDGDALSFTPGIGDLVTSNGLNASIRTVQPLQGPQGVTTFYRLVMENA
jgi:hypothetical protein